MELLSTKFIVLIEEVQSLLSPTQQITPFIVPVTTQIVCTTNILMLMDIITYIPAMAEGQAGFLREQYGHVIVFMRDSGFSACYNGGSYITTVTIKGVHRKNCT